jgi:hypothetical protein
MSAHADDLRHWYAEHIGPSIIIAVGSVGEAVLPERLPPGRYLLHTKDVVTATELWINHGPFGAVRVATAAAPATPIDLTEDPRPKLAFMAKPPGRGAGTERKSTDGLSMITDAGSVNVVITRISRQE